LPGFGIIFDASLRKFCLAIYLILIGTVTVLEKVLIVEDELHARTGLTELVESWGYRTEGAADGMEGLERIMQWAPTIVVTDLKMPRMDGMELLGRIGELPQKIAVVMLTTYDNPTYMARAVAGGAAGYLLKGTELEELLDALRAVAQGEMLLTAQDLSRSLRGITPGMPGVEDLIEPLTDREQEVLRLLATGLPNREIASILFVAECTIKSHVEHIIGKLGVSDRVQAAVWAVRHGLISSPL